LKNRMLFFALSVFCLFTMPRLFSPGMFVDGVTFASVSRNLAEGVGTPWKPYYTDTMFPIEVDHLPLAFWMQSVTFWLFGDLKFLESVYGFALGVLSLLLMHFTWRKVVTDVWKDLSWTPLVLFSLVPMTSWAFGNNLLENTVTFLSMASVAIFLHGAGSIPRTIVCGALAGVLGIAAGLAKGPPGLFVFVTPVAAFFLTRDPRMEVFVSSVSMILVGGGIALMLLLYEPSRELFRLFLWKKEIYLTFTQTEFGFRPHLFRILPKLLLVPLLFLIPIYIYAKRPVMRFCDRGSAMFLSLALAGSVPYIVTGLLERYLLPALPFFAMTLAALFADSLLVIHTILCRNSRIISGMAVSIFAIAILATVKEIGVTRRDSEIHRDLTFNRAQIQPRALVTVCPPEVVFRWPLVAFMQRNYRASLTTEDGRSYLLIADASRCSVPVECRILNPQAVAYRFYSCARNS